ncbi:hypothetical protein FHX82_006559 [Amycolatopsis bartoniae]|uniref:Uncharacterized protein n=1 Tax=Amycolatopsis bartoniae TaxID=941986 RepID=A0A8H9IVN3_9PSEU|nr:hypothetical protein [Amycolatopsis bartoniae]MBB2939473.1 hypothetical protein [Amycolatopsis bartoniae]TVT11321.1 hypothetical protein FNH07_02710 [Amycolatopsis bartoniae]GHF66663.1 hypothetical protein GCM10017566_45580 [Amycolatopsis bartoniae]
MAVELSVRREHLVAALLVGGVVVIVGFASGLGLKTSTTNAQAAGAPAAASPGTSVPDGQLPQASVPAMTMPGTELPAAIPADIPVSAGEPVTGGDTATVPVVTASTEPGPVSTSPVGPADPATPVTPTDPTVPTLPVACLPGAGQQLADTANTLVGELPVVGTLTGTLGLTQSPDGSSPGTLNTLLYAVTGYCAPTTAATATGTDPTAPLTAALPALAPPKVGG